ncbi:putative Glycerophosphodiester phosphodiesterase [Quillaja saponaria]|uniref:glycerophosphodiester phosphodiesterase n=1 Tax=Quillaja saponaria TaxID=32244 RepID=A0AAD7KU25_QUISA|nr:putative Glycerophosphodiester phosphodiesterase [Quillaja saponaria]
MALKAVHVSDVPNLDHVPDNASALSHFSPRRTSFSTGGGDDRECDSSSRGSQGYNNNKFPKFLVMGHRGKGMNMLQSPDPRMKSIKENSLLSFNTAAKFPIDFIEFDVQVTIDDCPVIFHDNFILTEDKGVIIEKRVTDITLAEFLSYGPQKENGKVGKFLFRKTKDARIFEWIVENDDPLCTLQEVFEEVESSIGFNIELKFDDQIVYKEEELNHVLQVILQVVNEYANDRRVIFSSFQPDAAQLMRKKQSSYPVFFLTNGGSEVYVDIRRNSLEEAIKLCLAGGLQGIVAEVKSILKNPGAVNRIKESNLSLLTYGQLNNVPEVVYVQHLMGVNGVIVDLVQEITEVVTEYTSPEKEDEGDINVFEGTQLPEKKKPQFSQHELSFLLKLISNLIQA